VFGGFSRRWACAVATVVCDPSGNVPGLLYRVGPHELATLDRIEGVPAIYERVLRAVVDDHGKRRRAHLYQLPAKRLVTCTPGLRYFHLIRRAYQRLGFDQRILVDAAFWEVKWSRSSSTAR
jgi:hypothetical protein